MSTLNSSEQIESLFAERGLTVRLFFILFILVPFYARAADVPQSFTLDGRLFSNATGSSPLVDSSVTLRIQILDEDKVCVLYEESQSISTLASGGYFSIQVGSVTGDGKRTALDSALPMTSVFQNINNVTGKAASNGAPCILTAATAKRRYVRVYVAPSTMGGAERQLSPDLGVDSVPNAVVAERAESLQGLRAANMLQVNTSASNVLSQTNLENLFSSTTRFNALTALVDGTSVNYMRSNSASGAQLPVLAGAPSSPTQGAVWYDPTDQKVKFQASGGPVTLSTGGGTVSSVGFTAPAELSVSGAPVTTTGTIAMTWANQTTNKVLAAPDGSTGAPSFRALVANDIPSLSWSKITGGPAPLTQGGTGLSAGGGANQILGMDAAGTAAEYKTLTAGSGMSVTHGVGTVTIATTGAAPTGAAGGDLSGTYPNPTVSRIQGAGVSATTPSNGQILYYDGGVPEWKAANFSIGNLKTAAGAQQFAGSGSCAANQTLTWSSLTDTFTCTTIASLDAGAITAGTIADARLPASATAWTVSGSDVYRSSGKVGIGTATPSFALDVEGGTSSTFAKFGNNFPVYLFDPGPTDYSGIGFNLSRETAANSFYYGKGSLSNYGGFIGVVPATGVMDIGITDNSGNAGAAAATTSIVSISRTEVTISKKLNANGGSSATPSDSHFQGESGMGTNIAGGNLLLKAGGGTGNAAPGYISFNTSIPTVSGNSPQGTSEKMRISGTGNVGIGTTTPTTKLHVTSSGSGNNVSSVSISSASAWDAGSFVGMRARGTPGAETYPLNGDRVASFSSSNGVNPNAWSFMGMFATENWASNSQGTAIRFYTIPNGGSITSFPRMTVDHNGNVGIGTTSPGQKLTVAGTIESTSGGIKFPDGTTQTTANPISSVGFHASSSAQTITNNVLNTMINPTVTWDKAGNYNSATGIFTAPVAGIYTCTCQINFESLPANNEFFVGFNGTGITGNSTISNRNRCVGAPCSTTTSQLINATVGGTIYCVGFQAGSASNHAVGGGTRNYFSCHFLGP